MKLESKYLIVCELDFETAFHIGSGTVSETSNSGILKDFLGKPILPGSTIKGKFRSTVERLASCINMSACLLNTSLSGKECISDKDYPYNDI